MKKNYLDFFSIFKSLVSERKMFGFRTDRILKICRISGPDMVSVRALFSRN